MAWRLVFSIDANTATASSRHLSNTRRAAVAWMPITLT
jgi:hypothetical protein